MTHYFPLPIGATNFRTIVWTIFLIKAKDRYPFESILSKKRSNIRNTFSDSWFTPSFYYQLGIWGKVRDFVTEGGSKKDQRDRKMESKFYLAQWTRKNINSNISSSILRLFFTLNFTPNNFEAIIFTPKCIILRVTFELHKKYAKNVPWVALNNSWFPFRVAVFPMLLMFSLSSCVFL